MGGTGACPEDFLGVWLSSKVPGGAPAFIATLPKQGQARSTQQAGSAPGSPCLWEERTQPERQVLHQQQQQEQQRGRRGTPWPPVVRSHLTFPSREKGKVRLLGPHKATAGAPLVTERIGLQWERGHVGEFRKCSCRRSIHSSLSLTHWEPGRGRSGLAPPALRPKQPRLRCWDLWLFAKSGSRCSAGPKGKGSGPGAGPGTAKQRELGSDQTGA